MTAAQEKLFKNWRDAVQAELAVSLWLALIVYGTRIIDKRFYYLRGRFKVSSAPLKCCNFLLLQDGVVILVMDDFMRSECFIFAFALMFPFLIFTSLLIIINAKFPQSVCLLASYVLSTESI